VLPTTGAQHLAALLADRPLGAFVLFSSVLGLFGARHQLAYTAANAALDALCERSCSSWRRPHAAAIPIPRCGIRGVYPTRGDDRWIAISLFDRASDHLRLVQLTGLPLPEPASGPDARAQLDQRLAAYPCREVDSVLMPRLQAAGLAAGVVQDVQDVLQDQGLRAR